MRIELKPCPFCENDKPMLLDNSPGNYSWIECRECSVRTHDYETASRAAIVWNRRPLTDEEIEDTLYEKSKERGW